MEEEEGGEVIKLEGSAGQVMAQGTFENRTQVILSSWNLAVDSLGEPPTYDGPDMYGWCHSVCIRGAVLHRIVKNSELWERYVFVKQLTST